MAIKPKALSDDQRKAFTAAYRWYEKYHGMDGTAEDWSEALSDATLAIAECGDTYLVNKLIVAVWDVIEHTQIARHNTAYQDVDWYAPKQTVMTGDDGKPVVSP